ncbi:MAG TPA: hypothetical protein VKA70_00020 [Blastocatellia bacterium]|nr:hypothetical protein [Blastocatellia bacterium]
MRRVTAILLATAFIVTAASADNNAATPTNTVISFYRALKQKQYLEGFRHSVYRAAVEGLSAADLRELEPDFARTFSAIPEKIEARGEQITGDTAVVFLKFDGIEELQQVALIREGGQWLVGDRDSLAMVRAQGKHFFFNTRIIVNEAEAHEMMLRIIGAELIYSRKFEGRNASMQELVRLGGLPKDVESQQATGYHFNLTLSADAKTFSATATPLSYGKTGKLSFYADINGVRAEDLKGAPASVRSPVYQPK